MKVRYYFIFCFFFEKKVFGEEQEKERCEALNYFNHDMLRRLD